MRKRRICPKCSGPMGGYPAISRKDNQTEICSTCGLKKRWRPITATALNNYPKIGIISN